MTKTRPSLPALAVLLLFLAPLAFITPWVLVLVAPIALGAALVFGLPTFGLRPALKPDEPDKKVDLLCLEGLEEHPEIVAGIERELEAVWANVPEHEDPAACACVKRSGDAWVGVLRMRSTKGHCFTEQQGSSPEEVGEKLTAEVRSYRTKFPILQPEPEGFPECTSAICHLGRGSLFYIDRDKYGRPRAQHKAA